jgi:hypothetical protein
MIRLTPALLVGTASAFIGLGVDQQRRSRTTGDTRDDGKDSGYGNEANEASDDHGRGAMIERLLRRIGAHPRAPWDAALVHHAGYWSHFDPRPEVGDLFVLWSDARKRFVHAGIVLQVGEAGEFLNGQTFIECDVLSPNVHANGRIGGPDTLRLMRRICPDRGDWFIRWTELDDEPERGRDDQMNIEAHDEMREAA